MTAKSLQPQSSGSRSTRFDRLHALRLALGSIGKTVHASHRHPKSQGSPRDLAADPSHSHNSHRGAGKVNCSPIDRVDRPGPGHRR